MGVVSTTIKTEVKLFKVVDYLLDEYYEVVGVKYEDDFGNIQSVRVKVPDEFLDEGLERAYIKIAFRYFNDVLVGSSVVNLSLGTYRRCPVCCKITKNHVRGLCQTDYIYLLKVAKSHVEDEFEIEYPVECDEVIKLPIEKYDVTLEKNKVFFKKNLENVRGKQLVLPFNYLEF
jgi:hypothetical protein